MKVQQEKYRHEWKHEISHADLLILRQRLSAVMQRDPHAQNGSYEIRSLYFDTPEDTALREKIDGVNKREKFRIRYYNQDVSHLRLEKKSKINGLCKKESAPLQAEQVQALLDGEYHWMEAQQDPLIQDLHLKMTCRGLRPKTIVDYTREPFIFAPGNVRVTLDHNIRTGLLRTDFLSPGITIPAGDPTIILEVKWDEFLPDLIRGAVFLDGRRQTAFSKYAACRIYG